MTQKTLAKHLDEYTALAQQIAALEAQKPGAGEYLHDWLSGRKRILRSSLLQEMQQP